MPHTDTKTDAASRKNTFGENERLSDNDTSKTLPQDLTQTAIQQPQLHTKLVDLDAKASPLAHHIESIKHCKQQIAHIQMQIKTSQSKHIHQDTINRIKIYHPIAIKLIDTVTQLEKPIASVTQEFKIPSDKNCLDCLDKIKSSVNYQSSGLKVATIAHLNLAIQGRGVSEAIDSIHTKFSDEISTVNTQLENLLMQLSTDISQRIHHYEQLAQATNDSQDQPDPQCEVMDDIDFGDIELNLENAEECFDSTLDSEDFFDSKASSLPGEETPSSESFELELDFGSDSDMEDFENKAQIDSIILVIESLQNMATKVMSKHFLANVIASIKTANSADNATIDTLAAIMNSKHGLLKQLRRYADRRQLNQNSLLVQYILELRRHFPRTAINDQRNVMNRLLPNLDEKIIDNLMRQSKLINDCVEKSAVLSKCLNRLKFVATNNKALDALIKEIIPFTNLSKQLADFDAISGRFNNLFLISKTIRRRLQCRLIHDDAVNKSPTLNAVIEHTSELVDLIQKLEHICLAANPLRQLQCWIPERSQPCNTRKQFTPFRQTNGSHHRNTRTPDKHDIFRDINNENMKPNYKRIMKLNSRKIRRIQASNTPRYMQPTLSSLRKGRNLPSCMKKNRGIRC